MANRLEPINLIDFTGGLNLRKNQFQLLKNESPEIENITIDPLGGIYTRRGWERFTGPLIWNPEEWDPRRAHLVQFSDGLDVAYIAANGRILWAVAEYGANFQPLALVEAEAEPHMADFANFGDTIYIALGASNQMIRRHRTDTHETLIEGGAGTWNDDYLTPGATNVAPKAELVEAHSGYLFAANIIEDEIAFPNRIRWSHPTSQTDWAAADFIDIETGGQKITALQSYEDHLLIFKHDSVWALYGYNAESWQLLQKSSTIGAVSPQSVTRNEQVVFFYSASDLGGIYVYAGERPQEISEQLRLAMHQITRPELIWVGWIARRLWVTLPWTYSGPTEENAAVFVFDPAAGERGAWTYFTSTEGSLGPIVSGSNVDTQSRPLGVLRATETPCVVRLDALDVSADQIWAYSVLGWSEPEAAAPDNAGYLVTGLNEDIELSGQLGLNPFPTVYRSPWIDADWPTRKKSFRRPDVICRYTGFQHELKVRSYRDFEEVNAKRQHTLTVPAGAVGGEVGQTGQVAAVWNTFNWNDGTQWNQPGRSPDIAVGPRSGATIRRGSSFGLCRALQLRLEGVTSGAKWGVDAIILKIVLRRFR